MYRSFLRKGLAVAAGVAAVTTMTLGAGTAAAAPAAGSRTGTVVTTSQAGYVTGGRWFRLIATTVRVTPQPQHSDMAPNVTSAEVVLGGAGVRPATLRMWAGGGPGSVGYSYFRYRGGEAGGTLPISPAVGDTVVLSVYYDKHGHISFTAIDLTKGAGVTRIARVGRTIYTAAEAAGWIDNSITTAPKTSTRLWAFRGTRVTTYSGVHGTLLGPWATSRIVDRSTSGSGALVISPSPLRQHGQNFGVWLRPAA